MRFMVIRKADKETEASMMPTEDLIAAMGKYNEEMVKAGVMIAADGLQPAPRALASSSPAANPPSSTDRSAKQRSWSPATRSFR